MMTIRDFLSSLQDYYGERLPAAVAKAWVGKLKYCREDEVALLYQWCLENFERRYGKVPGIAEVRDGFASIKQGRLAISCRIQELQKKLERLPTRDRDYSQEAEEFLERNRKKDKAFNRLIESVAEEIAATGVRSESEWELVEVERNAIRRELISLEEKKSIVEV